MHNLFQKPKNVKFILLGIIVAVILLGLIFDKGINKTNPTEPITYQSKISSFNYPSDLASKCTSLGIGKFSPWKDLTKMNMGYCSLTEDYPLGTGVNESSISMSLNSKDKNYVHNIEIELFIGNPSAYNQGLNKLSETTKKTFELIDQTIPAGLIESINNRKPAEFKFNNGAVDLVLERGNNNTARWTVKIIEI